MKNKKALVLIPAFSVLTLTTLASVSGAVAWFTANRQVEADVSEMTITRLNGNLEITATKGDYTVVTSDSKTKQTITIKDESNTNSGAKTYLTHASFDGTHVYAPNLDFNPNQTDSLGQPVNTGRYVQLNPSDKAGTDSAKNSVVYAAQWTLTFKYSFGGDRSNVDLFLDTNPANVTTKEASNPTEADTKTGVRFNFMNKDTKTDLTWAPFAKKTNPNYVNYVGSADDPKDGRAYGSRTLIASEDNMDGSSDDKKPYTDTSATKDGVGYLGQFVRGESSDDVSLTYTVTAWFEGTDPGVVDGAKLRTITANLKFYARKDKAAGA